MKSKSDLNTAEEGYKPAPSHKKNSFHKLNAAKRQNGVTNVHKPACSNGAQNGAFQAWNETGAKSWKGPKVCRNPDQIPHRHKSQINKVRVNKKKQEEKEREEPRVRTGVERKKKGKQYQNFFINVRCLGGYSLRECSGILRKNLMNSSVLNYTRRWSETVTKNNCNVINGDIANIARNKYNNGNLPGVISCGSKREVKDNSCKLSLVNNVNSLLLCCLTKTHALLRLVSVVLSAVESCAEPSSGENVGVLACWPFDSGYRLRGSSSFRRLSSASPARRGGRLRWIHDDQSPSYAQECGRNDSL